MLCQAVGQRAHRPACETQLDPSVIPGARWEQRGEQQSEVWPDSVVRSIQPGGELEEEKGQDEELWPQSQVWGAEGARLGAWAVFGS